MISGLAKAFGVKKGLNGVDLSVVSGENIVVIGGSGSGKSVLLKCILGLVTPDSGSVQFDGRDVTHVRGQARDDMRQRCGMLFQQAALFDSLPVWENVAFGLIQSGKMGPQDARETAIDTLSQVGMGRDVADLYPAELSGGMQKRVGWRVPSQESRRLSFSMSLPRDLIRSWQMSSTTSLLSVCVNWEQPPSQLHMI